MKDNLGLYYFHQGTNYYAYKYLGSHMENGQTVFLNFISHLPLPLI